MRDAALSTVSPGAVARLRSRGAYRWYGGAMFGLVYQAIEVVAIITAHGPVSDKVLAIGVLVVLYAVYLAVPPLVWPERRAVRVGAVVGYWVLTCVLFPLIGPTTVWVWALIAAMVGFTWVGRVAGFAVVAAIGVVQIGVAASLGWPDSVSFAWIITVSVGVSCIAFGAQIEQNQRLEEANAEIARLAVADERARLARDLHDSLGHSLTVVAVKSELAARVMEADPRRAASEILDVQELARSALTDLRASVAGFRDVTLDAELATARTALEAAGVEAELPDRGDAVRTELRPLFGWAVREGVTNVIRHGGAATCRIEVGRDRLLVVNDGPVARIAPGGTGLAGLRERAAAVGASVVADALPGGGFELVVSK